MEYVMSKLYPNAIWKKSGGGLGSIPKSRPGQGWTDGATDAFSGSVGNSGKGAAAGAAAGAGLMAGMSGVNQGEAGVGTAGVQALINGIRNFSSDKENASIEHLKAPLNAAIVGWLQSNAPLVNEFFAITGKQPTDMVDTIVSAFRNRNAGASIGTVDDVMMSVLETSKERQALKRDEFEFQPGYEGKVNDTLGSRVQWENVATAAATLDLAAGALPGGIRALLAIREALEMEKGFFNEIFERVYGYSPEEYVASAIDERQSRISLSIR